MNDNKKNLEILNLITNQDISLQADGGDILWLMEIAKKVIRGIR
jgi:hypothetical protein